MIQTTPPSFVKLSIEEFAEKNAESQQKWTTALQHGICYIKIPDDYKKDLGIAQKFAETIREREQELRQFQLGRFFGYQVRPNTQAVAFLAKQKHWLQVYPSEVQRVASKMHNLTVQILCRALEHLSVPKTLWDQATGDATKGEGTTVLTFNHYQKDSNQENPEQKVLGLTPHRDMGWLALLFADKQGLQAQIKNEWIDVPFEEGYFVCFIGKTFELLMNDRTKLSACYHRVTQVVETRISGGLFINNHKKSPIYQITLEGELEEKQTYDQFMADRFAEFEAARHEK